ncbi:hypothetical protein C8R44DRAFT_875790 [Mycena epipterygia]|nr:hypothetical protein C8R44DRAFT_875790 [Mycena epipterygia]
MSRPPGLYHRLAWVFSLLYIVSAGTTIYTYGFTRELVAFLLFPVASATITLGLLSKIIPYTTYVDETHPFSRVGKHFVFIGFLMSTWFPFVLRTPFQVVGGESVVLSQCRSDRYLTLRCLPIGTDAVLVFAIFATLTCASWTVYHRATAIHGEEVNIALPPGIPHPANFYPFKRYPPGSEVPVWMLAHIAETESDDGTKRGVELV